MTERDRDALGLSFDMLDVDRLRVLADVVEANGAVHTDATRMRDLATRLEQAVKDIGVLRAENARLNVERDQWRSLVIDDAENSIARAMAFAKSARETVDKLRRIIRDYAKHPGDCPNTESCGASCDCGIAWALEYDHFASSPSQGAGE